MIDESGVIAKVRRALGRSAQSTAPPQPPELPESIVRTVRPDADLAAVFAQRAGEMKMDVTSVASDEVIPNLIDFLRMKNCRRIATVASPLLERLGTLSALREALLEAKYWDEMTLDELYDFDCAVTDVHYAVAETGSLVIKPSAQHGRGLSLVPMFHVAFIERKQILPDLIDFFDRLKSDADAQNVFMISGPSKTADIEMNVVTGVHGPNVVKVFLLP